MSNKFKSSLYYVPSNVKYDTPPDTVKNVYITNKQNHKLHGWYYNPFNTVPRKIILFCHGNAGNMTTNIKFVNEFISHKIPFLMFDYRGFGESEGITIVNSTFDDALDWMNYLINDKHINKNDIVPVGNSIGSYPVARLASEHNLPKVIIISGFHSVTDVVKDVLIFPVNYLASIFTSGDLFTGKYLNKYNGNALLLHSKDDEVIPYKHAEMNGKYGGLLIEIGGNHDNPDINWNFVKDFMQ